MAVHCILQRLSGDIDTSTSGGRIDGEDISGELSARTSGGSVNLGISALQKRQQAAAAWTYKVAELGKWVRVSNSGGGIDLQLPAGKGLDLDLSGNNAKQTLKFQRIW